MVEKKLIFSYEVYSREDESGWELEICESGEVKYSIYKKDYLQRENTYYLSKENANLLKSRLDGVQEMKSGTEAVVKKKDNVIFAGVSRDKVNAFDIVKETLAEIGLKFTYKGLEKNMEKDKMNNNENDLLEMEADVEEYYEAAGFADFHERCMKDSSEEEIKRMHVEAIGRDFD